MAGAPDTIPAGVRVGKPAPPAAPEAVPGQKGISLSDAAVARLKAMLALRGTPEAALRVAVRGGGCSGTQYDLRWEDLPRDKDRVYARDGVKLVVDPKSYVYLIGSVLNYEQGLLQSGFKLSNPKVKSSCGCGDSFTV